MNLRSRIFTPLLASLVAVFQSSCVGAPDGVQAVSGFELNRYLGTWYEIARLDHRFERGMSDVTATYSLRDDGGINVVNRGYKASSGEWNDATGKAYFVGAPDTGQLKVSFFGPFYGGYNIIALDKDDYQYALIAGPDRGYLWILARSRTLEPAVLSALIAKARRLNFPTDELIFVDHLLPD
ncbi:lipocalin family protein [Woeseia oceani]|uniref:Outer membrane lipoprotein Blc n=1 Tax=Woeseia oceani TaxID=1548547 RepID=A0A193LD47_9GAMM|nr:lipocalin family protein [Woeseia oceani]ANO50403.1 lipocalin [Woeseia oceani]